MAVSITHAKVLNTALNPDFTQADIDTLIGRGQFAAGTTAADIALGSDHNSGHVITGIGAQETYLNHTTSAPLTADQTHAVITNTGASALVIDDLPAAAVGLKFTFIVTDANGFRLDAAGSDTIRIGGSVSTAGGTQTCTQIGGSLTIYGHSGGWISVSSQRTWIEA